MMIRGFIDEEWGSPDIIDIAVAGKPDSDIGLMGSELVHYSGKLWCNHLEPLLLRLSSRLVTQIPRDLDINWMTTT